MASSRGLHVAPRQPELNGEAVERPSTTAQPREKVRRHAKAAFLRQLKAAPLSSWPQALVQCLQTLPSLGICLMTELTAVLRAAVEHTEAHLLDARVESSSGATRSLRSVEAETSKPLDATAVACVKGRSTTCARVQPMLSLPVRRIRRLIRAHYGEQLSVSGLAARVGRNTQYISTLFHRQTGTTIHRYLTSVRMRQAAKLLRRREKVEAVMLLVGYRGKKNFYRQFEASFGITPGRYKARHSKTDLSRKAQPR
jgi:AraC-like DNA-binding protein